jgi:hypothetical protein
VPRGELDAAGNWPPERALITALAARGHEVRVRSHEAHRGDVVAAGAQFRAHDRDLERDPTVRRDETPEAEMARVFQDVFLNSRYAESLLAEVPSYAPDVLLVDQMLLMAAAAAESTRLPTALLWHTVFGGRVEGAVPMPSKLLDPLNAYRRQLGLERIADRSAAAARADAIVAFTYEEFDAVPRERPKQLHYAGPFLAPTSTATARRTKPASTRVSTSRPVGRSMAIGMVAGSPKRRSAVIKRASPTAECALANCARTVPCSSTTQTACSTLAQSTPTKIRISSILPSTGVWSPRLGG